MKAKHKVLSILFSCYVVLIPILEYYQSPVSFLNMSTFLSVVFLLFFVIDIFFNNKRFFEKKERWMLGLYAYILMVSFNILFSFFKYNYSLSWNNISVYLRFLCLFISLVIIGRRYFSFKVAIEFLRIVLVLSAFLILVQDVFLLAGHPFKVIIPLLIRDEGQTEVLNRFGGLYMEPAHFTQSALIYLCYTLFKKEKQSKKEMISLIAVVLGIVLSGSGQGYLFLAITYLLWIAYTIFNKNIKNSTKLLAVFSIGVISIACVILSQFSIVQTAMSRIIGSDGSIGGQALAGRTYTNELFWKFDNKQRWYGVGLGHIKDLTSGYVNGLYSHLMQFGYLGLIVLAFLLLMIFVYGETYSKIFVVLYLIMIVFASVATPSCLCFYILFLKPNEKKSIKIVPNMLFGTFATYERNKTIKES